MVTIVRPGKVDLQFIVRALSKKHAGGRSFSLIHYQKIHFFQRKLSKGIQKFMRVRKSVKNWSKIAIMKLEAVVFGVMRAMNCKSTFPGLTSHKLISFAFLLHKLNAPCFRGSG